MPPRKRAKGSGSSSAPKINLRDPNKSGDDPQYRAMAELWRAGELCDFTVKVESSTYACHKLVLASASSYFRALLPGDRYADSHDHELNDMQSAVFDRLLTFVYDGECSVADDMLPALLEAASRLQVDSLQAVAAEALMHGLSAANCIDTWVFAERAGLADLEAAAKVHTVAHFEAAVATEAFSTLSREMLEVLLASDDMPAKEEVVFDALVSWLRAQEAPAREESSVAQLMQHVRFAQMAPEFINERVEKEPLMDNRAAFKVLAQAMKVRGGGFELDSVAAISACCL